MEEKHICKKCNQSFDDFFEVMKHTKECFPKDYQGVLFTTYTLDGGKNGNKKTSRKKSNKLFT